jgi:hypothetical protein
MIVHLFDFAFPHESDRHSGQPVSGRCFAITVTLALRDKDSASIFMNEHGAESSTTAHGYAARCSPRAVRSYNLYPNPPKTYILSGPYSSSGIDELKQLWSGFGPASHHNQQVDASDETTASITQHRSPPKTDWVDS